MPQHRKLRSVLVLVAAGLCLLAIWQKTSSVVVTIATIGLLYVTAEYLLVTRENLDVTQQNLDLFRQQLQRQERVVLYFDLAIRDRSLWLRISNLGLSNFLLQTIHLRKRDKNEADYEMHQVGESGKTEQIKLPDGVYKGDGFGVDIELTLKYRGLDGTGKTPPKCFSVSLGLSDEPIEVLEELDSLWYVGCPKCSVPAVTNVHGLKTFEAAEARSKKLEEDLAASCPDHNSEFLLTVEDVQAQHEQRRNKQPL